MQVTNLITEILSIPVAGLLLYAALHDFAARTVPNWLPLTLFGFGVMLRWLDHSLLAGLAVAAITFAVLFVIWLLRAVGGGDVKLWAAAVLLVPPVLQPQLYFLCGVMILGGVLALVYLALCFVVPKRASSSRRSRFRPAGTRPEGLIARVLRAEAWRIGRRAPLPYAFAISASAIVTFLPLSFQR